MKVRWLVLYTSPYKVTDEKTGEVNEGVSVFFLPADNLKPCEDRNMKGVRPGKCSFPIEQIKNIQVAPALYDVDVDMKVSADMKAMIKPVSLSFVNTVNLAPDK